MAHHLIRTSIATFLLLCAQCALAQSSGKPGNDRLTDRFSVAVGAFFPDTDTTVRADASNGMFGTKFSYEDQLKLDDSDASVDVSLLWRVANRHSLELEYFDIGRDGRTSLDVDIRFGDLNLQQQVAVDSFLKTRVLRFGYGYSFLRTERYQFGAHLGIHTTEIDTGVSVIGNTATPVATEFFDTTAPLPVIGFFGDYRFADKWVLYGRAQYFELELDRYDGRMIQGLVGIEHDTFNYVSLGVGYRYFDIQVDVEDGDWTGEIDFRYSGPTVFFRVRF